MVDISVICVTKRFGGIDILADCLSRQTFTNYELILVDELYEQRKDVVGKYLADKLPNIKVIHTPSKMRKPARRYGLCNALNTGLLRSHGELIVWLQDYIWLQPDALERYWNGYNQFPNKIIGGLKDHYSGVVADDPKGLISLWPKEHWKGDPANCVLTSLSSRDNRYKSIQISEGAELIQLMPIVYEMCNASMPYSLAVALNGVDESLDDGRAYDNQNISFRALMVGYETVIDVKNVAREFNHQEYFGEDDKVSPSSLTHPDSNYERLNKILIDIQAGKYPLRAPNDFSLSAR